jgi:hypothetical protein
MKKRGKCVSKTAGSADLGRIRLIKAVPGINIPVFDKKSPT